MPTLASPTGYFRQRTVSAAELEGGEDDRGEHEHRDDGRLVAQSEAVDDVGRGAGLARHRHLKNGGNYTPDTTTTTRLKKRERSCSMMGGIAVLTATTTVETIDRNVTLTSLQDRISKRKKHTHETHQH